MGQDHSVGSLGQAVGRGTFTPANIYESYPIIFFYWSFPNGT